MLAQSPTPAAPPGERWLSRREAADHCGLSVRTLERAALDGSGPPFSTFGRRALYPLAELNAWMRSRLVTSTSAATVARAARP